MEFVYVIPRSELFPDCTPHGFQAFGDTSPESDFHSRVVAGGYFVERPYAERSPALKQVIPYAVVVKDGQILLLRRTKGGGEARLHDKLTIGVGGHVNPVDLEDTIPNNSPRDPLPAATRREVSEELLIDGTYEVRSIGILNDDTNPVGAVHVGLVQVITVEGTVEIRETDQLEGRLVSVNELRTLLADGENFETWSSFLIPHLDQLVPETITT